MVISGRLGTIMPTVKHPSSAYPIPIKIRLSGKRNNDDGPAKMNATPAIKEHIIIVILLLNFFGK